MGIIAGIISMFGWGVSDFLGALSSRRIGSVLTLFWMNSIGFLVALIYFLFNFKNIELDKLWGVIPLLAGVAFFEVAAYLAFFEGFRKGQISLVSCLANCWAIIPIGLSLIFFKEVLQTNQVAAIILIFVGIILISLDLKSLLYNRKLGVFAGTKEGLMTMAGWGIYAFLLIQPSRVLGWFLPVFVARLFMVVFFVGYLLFTKTSVKKNFQPSFWFILLAMGVSDIGSFFAYSLGVGGAQASIVAPLAASSPFATVALSRIFLKEKLARNQLLGMAGVLTGIVLISIS